MTSVLPLALGLGWGALAAAPVARRARQAVVAERVAPLRGDGRRRLPRWARLPAREPSAMRRALAPLRRVAGIVTSRRAIRQRDERVAVELPVVVDLLAVAVGAGCTPYVAVDVAGRWAPPALAAYLEGVRRACSLGGGFADVLDDLAAEVPALRALTEALLASDRFGAPVADALVRLAGEERAALRRRAEARARTVPVRLLFPLVFLVLPAFGLLTLVPSLLAALTHT